MVSDYWQPFAGNFVVIGSNSEGRPSNGKQHDDNYMEGYLSNFRTLGEFLSQSASFSVLLYFSFPTMRLIQRDPCTVNDFTRGLK